MRKITFIQRTETSKFPGGDNNTGGGDMTTGGGGTGGQGGEGGK